MCVAILREASTSAKIASLESERLRKNDRERHGETECV